MRESVMFKSGIELRKDNVYLTTEVKPLSDFTGMPSRRGLERCIVSNGKVVNVVSNQYGLLKNEDFFRKVEQKLTDHDIKYDARLINREDCSFAADFILNDERYIVKVKNGKDELKPMLRLVNSYDGSCKTSGNFGYFRKVCSNGLHVAESKVGFQIKHRGAVSEIVMPELDKLIIQFIDNEFYTLSKKFEVLAETPVKDLTGFVKLVVDETKLFMFETSAKNPLPSKNAREIIETVNREATLLGEQPNKWLVYNAINELLHDTLKKSFTQQQSKDLQIFETVLAL